MMSQDESANNNGEVLFDRVTAWQVASSERKVVAFDASSKQSWCSKKIFSYILHARPPLPDVCILDGSGGTSKSSSSSISATSVKLFSQFSSQSLPSISTQTGNESSPVKYLSAEQCWLWHGSSLHL